VILGGLLAGVVINASEAVLNLFVIPGPMEESLRARNLPPVNNTSIGMWIFLSFLLGIVTVWLYAAIRPRYGAGVGTAIMAGLAVFFLAYLYMTTGLAVMGFFPRDLMLITLCWGLVEILVASVVGAWAYKE
jgi:hypothetical protein